MPFANEHSCRLVDPGRCKDNSFRRENGAGESNGKQFDIIYAELKDSGETVSQAYRYPTSNWSEAEAREHCQNQDSIKFEPAESSMILPQILGQAWAISEFGLEQVKNAVDQVESVQAIAAKFGETTEGPTFSHIRDGVAIIEAIGPMFHYQNLLSFIFGFPSAEGIMQEIQQAMENPEVNSIILQVDSPGGQVGGISELANFIKSQNEKPIKAYVGDTAASAAYWVASAADEVVAANTAELGSIGVVFSMRRKSDNTLEIVNTSSPKKRPDLETREGRRQVQERADAIAEVFISAVAQNRNISKDEVISLEGNVVIASKAVEAKLADRIGSLEDLISELQNQKSNEYGGNIMNLDELKKDYAELYSQVKAEGRQEVQDEIEAKQTEAKQQVQQDMLSLAETLFGEKVKAKLSQAVDAGLTVDQIKAAQGLFESQGDGQGQDGQATDTKAQLLNAIEQNTPDPASRAEGDNQGPQDFETAVQDQIKQQGCTRGEAIKAMAEQYPELHQQWLDGHNK